MRKFKLVCGYWNFPAASFEMDGLVYTFAGYVVRRGTRYARYDAVATRTDAERAAGMVS
jgi:hypothetical protein